MRPSCPNRVQRLLSALVCEYIEHGEPVSSQWLAGHAGCAVSSATVRNVLARLEEQGFVRQPHTSAGRVPTDRGYRSLRRLDHGRAAAGPARRRGRSAAAAGRVGRRRAGARLARAVAGVAARGLRAAPRRRTAPWHGSSSCPLEASRILVVVVSTGGRRHPQGHHVRRAGDARGAGAVGQLPDRGVLGADAVGSAGARDRADARRARALRRAAGAFAAAREHARSRRCRPTASCSCRARRRWSITA